MPVLLLNSFDEVPPNFGPSVVTLGNFDGVHRGHAAVLARVRQEADARMAKAVAVTFDPHPLAVLFPDKAPAMVTGIEDRLFLLEQRGMDATLVLPFTTEIAAMSPRAWVKTCFVDALRAKCVVVGKDTRFGKKNAGDIATLQALGTEFDFSVVALADVGPGERYSSSQVRQLINSGEVREAAAVLGRWHTVTGEVVRGYQRGRTLGFPTANLAEDAEGLVPADGVYAGWVIQRDLPSEHPDFRLPAAISVGTNPTFDIPRRTVEAYVLDRTDLDLYGRRIAVEFLHRLRGNKKFDSIETLIAHMNTDVDHARVLTAETEDPSAAGH